MEGQGLLNLFGFFLGQAGNEDKTPLNDLFNKAVPTEETEDWLYPSLFSPDDF